MQKNFYHPSSDEALAQQLKQKPPQNLFLKDPRFEKLQMSTALEKRSNF